MTFYGKEGRVQIQVDGQRSIRFVGASVWCNVDPSYLTTNCINVESPQDHKEGVVAVVIVTQEKNVADRPFLLNVSSEDGKTVIDKDFEWMPPVGMKVRLTSEALEIVIDGETFSTFQYANAHGGRRVDGNTLCRYMANPCKETADAVRAAAGELEQKKTLEEELKQVKVELEAALARGKELEETVARHEAAIRIWYDPARRTVEFQQEFIRQIVDQMEALRELVCRKWWQRKISEIGRCLSLMESAKIGWRKALEERDAK